MTTPRRQVLRTPQPNPIDAVRRQVREQRLRARLEKERRSFDRWLARLNRACRAIDKQRRRITRLDRLLAEFEPRN